MHKSRLLRLASHLYEIQEKPVPGREFNLGTWFKDNGRDETGVCQTAACAVGEACCCIPEFQAAGLRLEGSGYMGAHPVWVREGERTQNWHAVEAFFDIDEMTAQCLFMDDYYTLRSATGPAQVAARIVELVHTGDMTDAGYLDDFDDYENAAEIVNGEDDI